MRKRIQEMNHKVCFVALLIIIMMLAGCTNQDEIAKEYQSEPIELSHTVQTSNKDVETDITYQKQDVETEPVEETGEIPEETPTPETEVRIITTAPDFSASDIPVYEKDTYVAINHNNPFFSEDELSSKSYEFYSELDSLGRCGVCVACVGQDIMPTQERGKIGDIKPSGWNQNKYNGLVDGNYLYNRCHLIAYELSAENANELNLITGTRFLNIEGMLPFENMVADYVKETDNHVMYRVTPIFEGDNLLATGVLMEGKSVEDNGAGILFCVFCYNVQPGVVIDYSDGSNNLEKTDTKTASDLVGEVAVTTSDIASEETEPETTQSQLSGGGMCFQSATGEKYHSINHCGRMNPDKATQITIEQAEAQGLERCKKCW